MTNNLTHIQIDPRVESIVMPEIVKIGKPGATSGGAAKTGIQEIEGATLAVEDLNAKGGVNGVKFELTTPC